MIKNIKGTKDILPNEIKIWQYIEKNIHSFFQQYGYQEIRTPKFESTNLFNRSIGEDTDIVSKEMYSWIDQGKNHLTLKPESTASVARAIIQHNLYHINKVNRLYYIDSLFRRERPQKGRFRQFEQFGIEAVGSESPEQDVEIISMAYFFYKNMKISDISLKINSIGSLETRKKYKIALYDFLKNHKNTLSDISQKRLKTNPLRILDTKIDFEKKIVKNAPKIIDFLDDKDREQFNFILNSLDALNIKYEVDHLLVRGLDYYSRTVFEIQSKLLGSQSALCGGGRYDYLIEELGGKPTPAIGFAAGIERLILSLNKDDFDSQFTPDIFIISMGKDAINFSIQLANQLRSQNNLVVINNTTRGSLKTQMKDANKSKANNAIIIGDDEIENNQIIIKNMITGEQTKVDFDKVEKYFK